MPIKWLDEQSTGRKIRYLDQTQSDRNMARIDSAFSAAESDPNLAMGEDLYKRGMLFPVAKNKLTGDVSLAVPGIIAEPFMAGVDAVKSVMQNGGFDPATGHVSNGLVQNAFAAAALGPGASFAAPTAKVIGGALAKKAASNVDEASKYGINLSRGQATGRFSDQAFEQDALTGGRGVRAQTAFSRQRDAQAAQVSSAADNIAQRLSGSSVDNPYDAVDNVASAIQQRASGLRDQANSMYKSAEASNAEIAPGSIASLSNNLRTALDSAGAMEGKFVAPEYPTAARALNRIETLMSKAPDGNVVGVGWQNIERVRSLLTNSKGSTPDEGRVIREMRKSLDGWIESGIDDALVSGDPKFLDDLKQARNLWSEYRRITNNDSNIIRKMADGSANSEQMANWIYGVSKVGGRAESSNTVREIKSLIGADHPAMNDIKRGVMQRLFNDRAGDQKTYGRLASDIGEFTTGKGRELAKELYGDEGVKELQKFAGVLRMLKPDDLTTNPSRSGQTVMRRVSEAMTKVAPFIGYTVAGLGGVVAGYAVPAVNRAVSSRVAREMVNNPLPNTMNRLPGRAATGLASRSAIGYARPDQEAQYRNSISRQY